jgi:hypothetical protein
MFEQHHKPLIPRASFYRRLAKFAAFSFGLIVLSLGLGILGYRHFEGMSWIDAFVNAAMIMGGMGPLGELHTAHGKLFAGFYALYCGLIFIAAVSIIMAPIVHRFLHRLHMDIEAQEGQKGRKK